MFKGFRFSVLALCMMVSACAAPQASPDKTVQELDKLKTDNKILDGALKRCKDRVPEGGEWPTIYSMGFFGDFWMKGALGGKVLELKRTGSDAEEQLFIIPRPFKKDPIKLEGKGLREIDAGVYAIILYKPPLEPEERKKQQVVVITYSDVRFVILFKPSRF